jgi:hypothetical protein
MNRKVFGYDTDTSGRKTVFHISLSITASSPACLAAKGICQCGLKIVIIFTASYT